MLPTDAPVRRWEYYDRAAKGRTAQQAVWEQSVRNEAATQEGKVYVGPTPLSMLVGKQAATLDHNINLGLLEHVGLLVAKHRGFITATLKHVLHADMTDAAPSPGREGLGWSARAEGG